MAGADAKCQDRANAANLEGSWKAWLSTSNENAKDRIPDITYKTVDGRLIAADKADLLDGYLIQPINRTEYGAVPAAGTVTVYTGTNNKGLHTNDYSCNNWTTDFLYNPATLGFYTYSILYWTDTRKSISYSNSTCSSQRRLYCFEQVPISTVVFKFSNAEEFRSFIFQAFGFTETAKNFIANNSTIEISNLKDSCEGGNWVWQYKKVFLNCAQYQAGLHELSHAWWHTYRLQNPDQARGLARDVVRLADGDGSEVAVAFAKNYVYGNENWKGMYCEKAGCADVHDIKDNDFGLTNDMSNAKINDWEIYAGLSSWTMGKFKNDPHALPEYMWKYFEPQFTGVISEKPYYEGGHQ